jgi:hypothetical protein
MVHGILRENADISYELLWKFEDVEEEVEVI